MEHRPPKTAKRPFVHRRHGESVTDPYHWLRDDDRKDAGVMAHLEAENDYTETVMKPVGPLRRMLYEEMLARIQETDMSVPVTIGGNEYYTRTVEGQQYSIHCRKRATTDAVEEILLDVNELARETGYARLGVYEISPDQSMLAYSLDTDGSEHYTLRIKDLATGLLLPDAIPNTYSCVEWAADNRTLFYTTLDGTHRPYRLHRHVLGQDPVIDAVAYEEADERFFLRLYKTKDHRYLVLHLESNDTSEAWVLDAADPAGEFSIVEPRRNGIEYAIEHSRGSLIVLTNDDAVNFRLVAAPVGRPSRENWEEFVPYESDVKLDHVEVFSGHMAVLLRRNGLRGIRVYELPGMRCHDVEFPESVYTLATSWNPEADSRVLRYRYESPVTPDSVFDYDMQDRRQVLRKRLEVLGDYDPDRYETERVWATSHDGTRVPVSLVHRRGVPRDGRNPLLLYGYGSYGLSSDPGFDSTRLSLLDRGWVFAIAHVRGGGEMGRPWYDTGKLRHKGNTFVDFLACAEHLVAENYTSADLLAIRGGSAGGLLVGAVANMRPELFRAVVAKVPFVDVVNTMFDESLPLTVIERDEWGDPRNEADYRYIRSYSPYDNVQAVDHPAMLVTAGLNDPRVSYWEPAKWVARLRELDAGAQPILLKTDLGAGHAGPSGRYERLRELALEFAFLIARVGSR